MLLTQSSGDEHIEEQLTFPKLKKTDIKNSDLPDVLIHSCSGAKKPSMPANALQRQVHSLKGCVCYIYTCLFSSLNESPCQTRKNVFYFTSKALFGLEKIKF